ncbi:hypothetical protein Tco_1365242, partial [Tanacetum coccineum]
EIFLNHSGLSGDRKMTIAAVIETKPGTGGFGLFFVARRIFGATDRISGHGATEIRVSGNTIGEAREIQMSNSSASPRTNNKREIRSIKKITNLWVDEHKPLE